MSWLLDTDVLCQPVKTQGDVSAIAWLQEVEEQCYTSTVVVAQIAYWIRKQQGSRWMRLQSWFEESLDALESRILSFNVGVAHVWADYRVLWEKDGKPMPLEDSYIAATAIRHGLTIATGNSRDFERRGVKVYNPFTR